HPAEAGVGLVYRCRSGVGLDSRLRGNDGKQARLPRADWAAPSEGGATDKIKLEGVRLSLSFLRTSQFHVECISVPAARRSSWCIIRGSGIGLSSREFAGSPKFAARGVSPHSFGRYSGNRSTSGAEPQVCEGEG